MPFSTSLKNPNNMRNCFIGWSRNLFQQHKLISHLLIPLIHRSRDTSQLLGGYQMGWML